MQTVQHYIAAKQAEFTQHPFFTELAKATSLYPLQCFAPQLTFWVMLFQDILRLNGQTITDPYLAKMARHHEIEDRGHDRWFLNDLQQIAEEGQKPYDIAWLFSNHNLIIRDASYALITEAMTLTDEYLCIILLLTLESSGHIFFERVAEYVEKIGYQSRLKYFSSYHLDVEKSHALFEEKMEEKLFSHTLSIERQTQARALIDRLYNAFYIIFNSLMPYVDTTRSTEVVEQHA